MFVCLLLKLFVNPKSQSNNLTQQTKKNSDLFPTRMFVVSMCLFGIFSSSAAAASFFLHLLDDSAIRVTVAHRRTRTQSRRPNRNADKQAREGNDGATS